MDLGLRGKTALVCASSKGLGRAVANELASEGVNLVICSRHANQIAVAADDIAAQYAVSVTAVSADLATSTGRRAVIDAVDALGGIDILVTNTGGPPAGPFEAHSLAVWEQSYQLLLGSAVALIQATLPGMKQRGWGRIIAITSMSVKEPVAGLILSNAVRSSVAGLAKSLATEVADSGVTVNCVLPGYTRTARMTELAASNPNFSAVIESIPQRRMGEPDEFAAAVAFIASTRASYINGASIPVDGGVIRAL